MDSREYISDRSKKLISALYRVTELLSDKEPLKWNLREKALILYDNLISLLNREEKSTFKKISDHFSQIINFLELFSNEPSISGTNYNILKNEYKKLELFLEEKKLELSSMPDFIPEFSIGQESPISPLRPIRPISPKPDSSPRKEKILEFLKQGPKTISEISPFFQEISEKSIQRDLLDLVKMGKIAAEGEKRWRKYKLLTNIEN